MTTGLLTDLDRLGDVLERTSRPIDVHQIVDRSPVALDMSLLDLRPGDRLIDDRSCRGAARGQRGGQ